MSKKIFFWVWAIGISLFFSLISFMKFREYKEEELLSSDHIFIQEDLGKAEIVVNFLRDESLYVAWSSNDLSSGSRYTLQIPNYHLIFQFWEDGERLPLDILNKTSRSESGFLMIPPTFKNHNPALYSHSKLGLFRVSDEVWEITLEKAGVLYRKLVEKLLAFKDRDLQHKILKDYQLGRREEFEKRAPDEKDRYNYIVNHKTLPKADDYAINFSGENQDRYGGWILKYRHFCDPNWNFYTKHIPWNTWNQSENCLKSLEKNGIRMLSGDGSQIDWNPGEIILLWNKKYPKYFRLWMWGNYENRIHHIWKME